MNFYETTSLQLKTPSDPELLFGHVVLWRPGVPRPTAATMCRGRAEGEKSFTALHALLLKAKIATECRHRLASRATVSLPKEAPDHGGRTVPVMDKNADMNMSLRTPPCMASKGTGNKRDECRDLHIKWGLAARQLNCVCVRPSPQPCMRSEHAGR